MANLVGTTVTGNLGVTGTIGGQGAVPVGGIIALFGVIFISLFGWRLIPKNRKEKSSAKQTRKKREELSISASKSIKKEQVEIIVDFK